MDLTFYPADLMKELGVKVMKNSMVTEIGKDHVVVNGERIDCDTVILSTGFRSNNMDMEQFYDVAFKVTAIGDLRRPATIRECIEEAYFSVIDV